MNIETHIQTIGPIFNSNGTVSYDFQVIQWTDKFLPTGRREIYDSWRIVEDKNGKFIERIELM